LVGSHEHIKKAKRVRKVFGGGMRQAGFLAAACIYALDNHVERLKIDHKKAKALGEHVTTLPYVTGLLPVDTNIVIFELDKKILATDMVTKLGELGILAVPFGKHEVRLVTHLDINDDMISYFDQAIGKLKSVF
jgi:threonine aldolase